MGLRPGRTIKHMDRPYTRQSRSKPRQSYVVGVPFPKLHQFEMGTKGTYDLVMYLTLEKDAQIRHNALEASRIVMSNFLEKKMGLNFFAKVLVFPHHVLREKPIATGAGADRYSRGMCMAFGKPVGTAVQMKTGQRLFMLQVNKANEETGRRALKKSALKLPVRMKVVVEKAAA